MKATYDDIEHFIHMHQPKKLLQFFTLKLKEFKEVCELYISFAKFEKIETCGKFSRILKNKFNRSVQIPRENA